MDKKLLLINDMAGYGKVALSVMIPILSEMGIENFNLPTALVSNTLDYGKFQIHETTDYMLDTIKVWRELGFSYDAVLTGFTVSEKQAEVIYNYCLEQKEKGAKIITDPIMGDEGSLYPGIKDETVGFMKKLCSIAHIIVPNITEACFLTETPVKEDYTEKDIEEISDRLIEMGAENAVITSVPVNGNRYTVVREQGGFHKLPYKEIPVRFPGTGDIFSAVMTGKYMSGVSLRSAALSAMKTVEILISHNSGNYDKFKGIPIEKYLGEGIF